MHVVKYPIYLKWGFWGCNWVYIFYILPLRPEVSTFELSKSFKLDSFMAETGVLLGWGKSSQLVGFLTGWGGDTTAAVVKTVE